MPPSGHRGWGKCCSCKRGLACDRITIAESVPYRRRRRFLVVSPVWVSSVVEKVLRTDVVRRMRRRSAVLVGSIVGGETVPKRNTRGLHDALCRGAGERIKKTPRARQHSAVRLSKNFVSTRSRPRRRTTSNDDRDDPRPPGVARLPRKRRQDDGRAGSTNN